MKKVRKNGLSGATAIVTPLIFLMSLATRRFTSGFFVKSEVFVLFCECILTNVDILAIINISTSVDILFLKERYYVGYKTYDNRCGI